MAELLLEIGTEEIPARMLRKLEKDLVTAVGKVLEEANLGHVPLEAYGGPRQVAVFCRQVDAEQADREETLHGPPVRIAYDDQGQPTKALQGFLRKNPGLSPANLIRIQQPKGEVVGGKVFIAGRKTREILSEMLPTILEKLHFPKNMRWGHEAMRFVRPIRSLLALLDGEPIPFRFAGVESGSQSFGHRLLGPGPFSVSSIDQYLAGKAANGIVVRHQDRVALIERAIDQRLGEINGSLVADQALLHEIADLVETPYVVLGTFEQKFLDIPREILIVSLRDHQKSFAVQDEAGALMPYFLSIANVREDGKNLIRTGNEWVLNARLYDAKFFWETDLQKDFDQLRQDKLPNMVFQTQLGTYFEKTERIQNLAIKIGQALALDKGAMSHLDRASRHCKTDLVSDLVFEFAELQGIAGGLLLARKGEPQPVADAIYDHYLPLSMEDEIPRSDLGAIVSLCDKLDTLTGCFAVGLIPTGSKDPYALRRAAQGIIRLLIEHQLPLSMAFLIDSAIAGYESLDTGEALAQSLGGFFVDRIRYYLKQKGFEHDLVEAVLAADTDRVDQTLKRAEAIITQRSKENFRTLALNLKRVNNVIADEADQLPTFDAALLSEPPELALYQAFTQVKPQIEEAAKLHDYNRAMDLMTVLADPVEVYFGTDGVYINTDNKRVRLNRKAMLAQLRTTLGLVADIACLE